MLYEVITAGKRSTCKSQGTAVKSSKKDIPSLIDLDRQCFGWERKKLLKLLLLAKENLSYLSIHNGELAGFALAKVYDRITSYNVCYTKLLRKKSRDLYI